MKGKNVTKAQEAMWAEMAEMTLAKCRESCHNLGSCCDSMYCEMAAEIMQKQGVKPPVTPGKWRDGSQSFLVDGKCVIPPHFRPLCSLHQCKIASLGFDPKDPAWTKKYFDLRERLDGDFE